MSDHLSVAASIAGLITIADIVVRKGYCYLYDLKNVEKDAKKLIDEVNVLSGILHSLKNVAEYLESDEYEFDPATQIHYVNACQKCLLRIQEELDGADPTSALGAKRLRRELKWPFEKRKTEELLADIEKHKTTMTLATGADQMSALLNLLRRGEALQKKVESIHSSVLKMQGVQHQLIGDETKKKMLQYLSKLDIEGWQRSNLALRQPGTGIWFTDGEDFKSWTSTENSKLWIYGIPGAGKTILVSSIVQGLSNFVDNRRALAFFYCDYKEPQNHDPVTIFGAIAKQLAVQNELCLQELEKFYAAHTGMDGLEKRATPDELCKLIRCLAMHLDESMIVVDGLDEISSGRSGVTRLLAELSSCLSIKMILASRPEIDIKRHLKSFASMSIAACSADLQLYVASEIEKRISNGSLTISDPTLKEKIMRTLVERAEGMFRWVSCQMDYLCECSTDRERHNALRKLPPDLPSSYRRILERVNASTKHNQQLVIYTLQWIIFGVQKLTMPALLEALSCIDNESTFDRACCTTADQLQHWCSSLVRMSSGGILEIAHFTVKEYLTSIDPMQEPQLAKFKTSEDLANANLATTCLTYLNYPTFKTLQYPKVVDEEGECRIQEYLDTYHFLTYAAMFWDEHARAIMDNPSIFNEVQRLFRPGRNEAFKFWKRLRFSLIRHDDNEINFRYNDDYETVQATTPLNWAAILALPLVCEWLLQNQLDVNETSRLGPPLSCALLQDTEVDKDDDCDCSDYEYKPIWRDCDRKKVIRMLIKRGSVIDTVSLYSEKTPLAISLSGTVSGVIELLLDSGAKLTFDELQEIIEFQLGQADLWRGLPTTPHQLAKFIIPDEKHGLKETIFRLGVILTIPWVSDEYSAISDPSGIAGTKYDATIVPECLDMEYNGPISESTLRLLRRTIEIQARLRSPDTLLALVEFLRKVEIFPNEMASALVRVVDRHLIGYCGYDKFLQIPAILTILDILEGLGAFLESDKTGDSLMHSALKGDMSRQIIDKLMKFVVDPGYCDDQGVNLIHLAAQWEDPSVLKTFFETHDCSPVLGMITKDGFCALNYAVLNDLDSTVEFLIKEYEAVDVRTIRLTVQTALQRQEDKVLEVMRTSKVFSRYLEAELSERKPLIRGSIDCMGTIDGCQTSLPCHIPRESVLDAAGNLRPGANEDVIMEDAA